MIALKRVYEEPSEKDGRRVLVERLWPRGVSKDRAKIDEWMKDVAPSPELRKWFGHDPARWRRFETRYRKELGGKKDALKLLKQKEQAGRRHTALRRAGLRAQRGDRSEEAPGTRRAKDEGPVNPG